MAQKRLLKTAPHVYQPLWWCTSLLPALQCSKVLPFISFKPWKRSGLHMKVVTAPPRAPPRWPLHAMYSHPFIQHYSKWAMVKCTRQERMSLPEPCMPNVNAVWTAKWTVTIGKAYNLVWSKLHTLRTIHPTALKSYSQTIWAWLPTSKLHVKAAGPCNLWFFGMALFPTQQQLVVTTGIMQHIRVFAQKCKQCVQNTICTMNSASSIWCFMTNMITAQCFDQAAAQKMRLLTKQALVLMAASVHVSNIQFDRV